MTSQKPWALITGAAGGIGEALVNEFVASGYWVIATDIAWENTGFYSHEVFRLKVDLANLVYSTEQLSKFYADVQKITNGVGITSLINNAAVQILEAAESLSAEQWHTTWNVNLHAPFVLIQCFLADLGAKSGSVVNISSIHATQTKKKFVAYATSKAALSSLTRNLAVDVGDKIRVNAIEPAAVSTDMLLAGFDGKPEEFTKLKQCHPIGRIAYPKEIAELAVFLCSDKSKFLQGACIGATGGIHGCLYDPV